MQTEKYSVTGMTCSACSAHVEKSVSKVEGVESVNVNLLTNSMTVTYNDAKTDSEKIISAVESGGYGAEPLGGESKPKLTSSPAHDPAEKQIKLAQRRLIISAIFTVPLFYISMGHMAGLPIPAFLHGTQNAMSFAFTQFLLCIPVIFVNFHYFKNGFRNLFKGAPNMDSLIAIGSSASVVYGIFAIYKISHGFAVGNYEIIEQYSMDLYFESAAMILTLITLGKLMEARAKGKTGKAIARLVSLAPKTATVEKDGKEFVIDASEVQKGDILIVKAGETVPVDGVIVSGNGSLDESAITGESVPADKQQGDKVTGATVNTAGYFKMQASNVGEDTTLSRIIRLVEEASSSKAPIAKLADKVSRLFVPAVISVAIIAVIAWLLSGADFEFAMSVGISVLVISCPCALGLATPTAIMVGTGKGAELGILIKSAESLETAHSIKTVVLDKTGTITNGHPTVTDIIVNSQKGMSADEFLKIAAGAEALSEHPLSLAVTEEAERRKLEFTKAQDITQTPGRGISAKISGKTVYAGNLQYIKELGFDSAELENEINSLAEQGKTPLIFADSGGVCGIIAVLDRPKATSSSAIDEFKKMGIKTVMLTGDNKRTAASIAKEVGVDEFIAEVLPQEKEEKIRELCENGVTAMVGDGINDAPALVRADVGIAIGAGTDIAVDSADIVLMKGDLHEAVSAVKLSRAVIRNIKQNLFWAFIYNAIGIPVAAGVFFNAFGFKMNPMLAAAAMSFSSVCVVANALRLRFFSNKKLLSVPENEHGTENEAEISNINILYNKEETDVMEKKIIIEGMSCGHCSARVEKALNSVEGVQAKVDLTSKTAFVTVSGDVSDEALKTAVTEAGYDVVSVE